MITKGILVPNFALQTIHLPMYNVQSWRHHHRSKLLWFRGTFLTKQDRKGTDCYKVLCVSLKPTKYMVMTTVTDPTSEKQSERERYI